MADVKPQITILRARGKRRAWLVRVNGETMGVYAVGEPWPSFGMPPMPPEYAPPKDFKARIKWQKDVQHRDVSVKVFMEELASWEDGQ